MVSFHFYFIEIDIHTVHAKRVCKIFYSCYPMNGIDQHYIKYLALVIQYGVVDLIECENVMLVAMKKYEKNSVSYASTILPLLP